MATVYYDGSGVILRVTQNAVEDAMFGAPADAAGSVTFDELTNVSVLAGMAQASNAYDCQGGVLRKNGTPVSIAPDSAQKQDLDALLNNAQQAIQDNATFLALASPTNAQLAAQAKALTRQNTQIIKRLIRLGRMVV